MPTIRDLVTAIREREGVRAAIVLSRDGLAIDGDGVPAADAERTAAHVPPFIAAAEELGIAAQHGALQTTVIEYQDGVAIVSPLSVDAVLLVLALPAANLAQLLYELRRHRANLASLD